MNHPIIPIAVQGASRERKRQAPKGRRVDPQALLEVQALLGDESRQPDLLIEHLHKIQDRYGCLSAPHLAALAQEMRLAQTEVYEVATFYHHFDVVKEGEEAPAALTVRVCDGLSCEMAGARDLIDKLPGILGRDVRIVPSPCIGRCEQAPAALVGQHPVPFATTDTIAAKVTAGETKHVPTGFVDYEAYRATGGYALLRDCVAGVHDIESVISTMESSGLRGLGGAGFPAGRKWRIVRSEPAPRLMAVNIDEGEPGTFKDRVLLNSYADLVFEGMTVAAWAVGASRGFLYLRGEYRHLLEPLEAVLESRRAANLLGPGICGAAGFDFDIAIHLGAGAYVCGEESALIESLEGKRGIPRNRPPYPVSHGYLQQPTTVNNVETFCAAALVAVHGGDWYRAIGTAKSAGTKIHSISGDCARPGIYEYPFGVSVRQMLADCGAENTLAVQISGPSGTCIDESEFDRRMAFEDLPSAGAFMIFDTTRDLFEVARNFTHFFAHESCGFCTPCRVGTSMLKESMDKIHRGLGTQHDLNEIFKLNRVLQTSAHCGLGHTACNPLVDTLLRFRPSYERRLKSLDFQPAFDLDGALSVARQMTGRDDPAAHLANDE